MAKTADAFSFSSFDPSKFTEGFRDVAEKGAAQSKDAYAKMKLAAEDATKTIETTLATAQAGTVELGLKTIDTFRTNAELSLSHMEALLGVKSISQLVELQTSFLRKQAEITVEQAKTLQETVKKVAEDVTRPSKTAAEKAMSASKPA
jgi:phasin